MKKLKHYNEKPFILDEARRYQEYLERKDINTKAEIEEIFGVSRARVTQYLNLLKLPKSIIQFLDKIKENDEFKKYLTERKLRPLTLIDNKNKCIEKFNEIIRQLIKSQWVQKPKNLSKSLKNNHYNCTASTLYIVTIDTNGHHCCHK